MRCRWIQNNLPSALSFVPVAAIHHLAASRCPGFLDQRSAAPPVFVGGQWFSRSIRLRPSSASPSSWPWLNSATCTKQPGRWGDIRAQPVLLQPHPESGVIPWPEPHPGLWFCRQSQSGSCSGITVLCPGKEPVPIKGTDDSTRHTRPGVCSDQKPPKLPREDVLVPARDPRYVSVGWPPRLSMAATSRWPSHSIVTDGECRTMTVCTSTSLPIVSAGSAAHHSGCWIQAVVWSPSLMPCLQTSMVGLSYLGHSCTSIDVLRFQVPRTRVGILILRLTLRQVLGGAGTHDRSSSSAAEGRGLGHRRHTPAWGRWLNPTQATGRWCPPALSATGTGDIPGAGCHRCRWRAPRGRAPRCPGWRNPDGEGTTRPWP